MKLDDLKISTKVALPAVALTIVSLALVGVSFVESRKAEAIRSMLINERAPAELEASEFNRRVVTIGYAAYRVVASQGTSKEAKEASAELDAAYKTAKDKLRGINTVDPTAEKVTKDFGARLDKIYTSARQGADLGLQDVDEAGMMVMAVLDPEIVSLKTDVEKYTTGHAAETEALVTRLDREVSQGRIISLVFGLLAIASALAFALWIGSRKIAAPLIATAKTMDFLAQGSVDVDVRGAERKDEVGAMARSVQVFKDNAVALRTAEAAQQRANAEVEAERRRNQELAEAAAKEQALVMEAIAGGLARLSDGDLTYRLDQQFPEAYKRLQSDFNGAIAQLEEAMGTIVHAASSIGAGSDEIASAADDLSRRSEQQAASLEETAAALDEITATVRRSSAGAQEASKVVGSTRSDAERSSVVVRNAVDAMNQIEKSSQSISQIIGVIDEIAFQTNLLALNAGVEAARAGEAGRGFAVVAQEVRALAQRSADAAKEIKTLISTSSQQVNQGVAMVGQTGEALQTIVAKVGEIDALVSEIAASGQEQATGLNEVNAAVNQMDQTVQQNAAMVEQSTAASHALKSEAGNLMQMISRFRVQGSASAAATGGSKRASRSAAPPPAAHRPSAPVHVSPGPTLASAASRPGANPVAAAQAKLAKAVGASSSDDWEEF
ncbi:methyl-accepting chemotaxis protein [Caulobacter vibrioides]|uniref:methyl-accepting chemotaxis protein n=1 Tax=Caulobacter vibrioides TaxID=155892 RepID=UPI000BB46A1D|nr:methyl-accepting chemotaxis protein [Caulobacter vibrioides]ATC23345.1 methyl-accepting chemotaxis protein [Caulobacter vibrioides]AZH11556.1 methyl-accepting chemotaxis protein [Caulobacter vibrioides]PLR11385.1 methyl-accepting chemotaxis protein [Caulobacter vibrioides]